MFPLHQVNDISVMNTEDHSGSGASGGDSPPSGPQGKYQAQPELDHLHLLESLMNVGRDAHKILKFNIFS